jgi:hypothetical protein
MTDDLSALIDKYRSKGVLLDSNLLVLLFVGLTDIGLVTSFKRTQAFTQQEFSLLKGVVDTFYKVITTPHVLTETSNFLGQLHSGSRLTALTILSKNIQSFKERRPEAKTLVQSGAFFNFGLTDSAILDLPPKTYLVLSIDAALIIALQKKEVDAINFNHLRQLAWQQ